MADRRQGSARAGLLGVHVSGSVPALVLGTLGLYGLLLELAVGPVRLAALRVLISLPALFVLPGLTLQRALFAGSQRGLAERWLLTLGLSVAAAICVGLALDLTVGLYAGPWIVAVALVTLFGQLIGGSGPLAADRVIPRGAPLAGSRAPWIAGVGAVLIAVAAIVVSVYSARRQAYAGFAQFWLVPRSSASTRFQLGVHSAEHSTTSFVVAVRLRGRLVRSYDTVRLRPGATWQAAILDRSGALPLTAVLYRDGREYRHVAVNPNCADPGDDGICLR